MRFASLGSGSAGNALIVEAGSTRLLLDCGFGIRETLQRLARLDVSIESLNGILVTHEHDDHAGGVFKLAHRYGIPVWLTHGTLSMSSRHFPNQPDFRRYVIDSHTPLTIRDLEIHPFPVPHDAREPVQFVFSDGHHRLGVLTDVGAPTPHIERMLSGCDALVLECNHDIDMLMNGPYARPLKQRVSGRLGHLDNAAAAELLSRLDTSRLQHMVAAHLSAQNNHPDLARKALSHVLNCEESWIGIADQVNGFDWRSLE
ncbi:MAG TPA: MBL fold metallo-hydrolase [Methylophilaceae bacterium]|jgi:phosphoribosyl 1,2-cyclic phosphodiesterase